VPIWKKELKYLNKKKKQEHGTLPQLWGRAGRRIMFMLVYPPRQGMSTSSQTMEQWEQADTLGKETRQCCDAKCPLVIAGDGVVMRFRAFCGVLFCCTPLVLPCVLYARGYETLHENRGKELKAQENQPLVMAEPTAEQATGGYTTCNRLQDSAYDGSVMCIKCCQNCFQ
jgi:hypothetical protein